MICRVKITIPLNNPKLFIHYLHPRLVSRDVSDELKGGYRSTLTPSDTSIDDSVKSGKVGKDVLLMYLNKTKPAR